MSQSVFYGTHKRVIARRFCASHKAKWWQATRSRGAILAAHEVMRTLYQNATSLRAEARLLTTAGFILLAIGFPLTMALTLMALSPEGLSPLFPAAVGGPPILLGYIACHYASARLARAKALEG